MARALIVGCGCRGTALGLALAERGWQIRGTSRTREGVERIDAEGFEGVLADPDLGASVVEHFDAVTALVYLMGGAQGPPDALAALHGPRFERIVERVVDSPVRRVVYEAAGSVPASCFASGQAVVEDAANRWHIPMALIEADPADHPAWLAAALGAVTGEPATTLEPPA